MTQRKPNAPSCTVSSSLATTAPPDGTMDLKVTFQNRAIGLTGVGYVAVDHEGLVYVADLDRGQIIKLSAVGEVLARWGEPTDGPAQFDGISGIAVDRSGAVYASDEPTGRIHKLSAQGRGLAQWGENGSGSSQLRHPQGLALDVQGNLIVADTYNSRIQVMSPSGYALQTWGSAKGSEPGQFDHPADVTVDHQGTVFVADTRNARIQRLSPLGQVLGIWQRGAHGEELACPVGIAVDGEGNVYVADSASTPRVVKLSPWGAWVATWTLPAEEAGGYVQGVAVDGTSSLYVTAYSAQNLPAVIKMSARGEVTAVWK